MASFNRFNPYSENVAEKVFNHGADTHKVVLSNSAPTASMALLSEITQIANGNGYTTGGSTAAVSSSSQSSGTYKLVLGDVVFTASGSLGPFRYAVLYDDTATNDEMVGWWDYGSSITLSTGETFTWDADATNGIMQFVPA